MSVRKGERNKSKLKYLQDAQNLCAYTFQMCNNRNHFPEYILPNEIKKETLEILKNIRYNLGAYTYNKDDKTAHSKYLIEALVHIDALYSLLDLAYNNTTYKIEPKSMEYWIGLIVNLEDSAKELLGLVPIC